MSHPMVGACGVAIFCFFFPFLFQIINTHCLLSDPPINYCLFFLLFVKYVLCIYIYIYMSQVYFIACSISSAAYYNLCPLFLHPPQNTKMAIVETPQSLSIDSFSYSWIPDLKPSLELISESFRAALDSSSDEASFIEMDPNMPPSKRFKILGKDFDFELPCSEAYDGSIVHADELFSNGLLLPLFGSSSSKSVGCSPSVRPRRVSSSSSSSGSSSSSSLSDVRKFRCSSLRRCRSLLSRKTIEKYLQFMYPLLEKIRRCRSKGRRNRGGDKRMWALKNSCRSSFSPPRTSVGSCPGDFRMSFESEGSIQEAVLHCKRSIGM